MELSYLDNIVSKYNDELKTYQNRINEIMALGNSDTYTSRELEYLVGKSQATLNILSDLRKEDYMHRQ